MRFVSLNMGIDDASLLRRTLARSLRRAAPDSADDDYRALQAMIGELDRLLDGEPRRRAALAPMAAPAAAPVAGTAGAAGVPAVAPQLHLMRGGRGE